jgi:Ser/Thr protein kinase RdoA (MazF antagonist)
MTRSGTAQLIERFVTSAGWVPKVDHVSYLASGEYNENFLVDTGRSRLVFRINHGSQLGLDSQIEYEFAVLQAVAASGVTPRPHRCVGSCEEFPRGALLMEYLPGKKLDYQVDIVSAAGVFARIHSLPPSEKLIIQDDPIAAIIHESRELLERYPDHPRPTLYPRLRNYLDRMTDLADAHPDAFADESLCIVNTEVNSGNFVVDQGIARLVDWEKAVVSYRYQDLAHFLVPTTTQWKDDYVFTAETRGGFLDAYHAAIGGAVTREQLDTRTALLERVILLRAFSWCYMALAEYSDGRTLQDPSTLARIELYFAEIDRYLGS